jgi:hypothetical protein
MDADEEVYAQHEPFHFPDQLVEVAFHLWLRQFSFPAPGLYPFTLLVEGEWVAQKRVRVYAREDES